MRYEKEYIDYLIKESKTNTSVCKLLDDYFTDEIDFEKVVSLVISIPGITNYHIFDKDKRIDDLWDESDI